MAEYDPVKAYDTHCSQSNEEEAARFRSVTEQHAFAFVEEMKSPENVHHWLKSAIDDSGFLQGKMKEGFLVGIGLVDPPSDLLKYSIQLKQDTVYEMIRQYVIYNVAPLDSYDRNEIVEEIYQIAIDLL